MNMQQQKQSLMLILCNLCEKGRVRPRKVATDLATGH